MPMRRDPSTPPPMIGKIGPYTVFMTPPSTPKPTAEAEAAVFDSPKKGVSQHPVQPPPQQFDKSAYSHHVSDYDSSLLGLFRTAVAKVQNAHSSLDDHLARWFGLNQSKYQWALDDYYESKGLILLSRVESGIFRIERVSIPITWTMETDKGCFKEPLSGPLDICGKEGVLVVWQLDTGKKKFLPLIGAPPLFFRDSLDPSLYSVTVATAGDLSCFAFMAVPSKLSKRIETTFKERNGVVLFFDVADPLLLAAWLVKKARGGSLGFLSATQSSKDEDTLDGKPQLMLACVKGDHGYILFYPRGSQTNEPGRIHRNGLVEFTEEGKYGYASIYGELPDFSLKRCQPSSIPSVPSECPWESIFSGSSHNMPPLTKLCLAFLDSLLEKRTTIVE